MSVFNWAANMTVYNLADRLATIAAGSSVTYGSMRLGHYITDAAFLLKGMLADLKSITASSSADPGEFLEIPNPLGEGTILLLPDELSAFVRKYRDSFAQHRTPGEEIEKAARGTYLDLSMLQSDILSVGWADVFDSTVQGRWMDMRKELIAAVSQKDLEKRIPAILPEKLELDSIYPSRLIPATVELTRRFHPQNIYQLTRAKPGQDENSWENYHACLDYLVAESLKKAGWVAVLSSMKIKNGRKALLAGSPGLSELDALVQSVGRKIALSEILRCFKNLPEPYLSLLEAISGLSELRNSSNLSEGNRNIIEDCALQIVEGTARPAPERSSTELWDMQKIMSGEIFDDVPEWKVLRASLDDLWVRNPADREPATFLLVAGNLEQRFLLTMLQVDLLNLALEKGSYIPIEHIVRPLSNARSRLEQSYLRIQQHLIEKHLPRPASGS